MGCKADFLLLQERLFEGHGESACSIFFVPLSVQSLSALLWDPWRGLPSCFQPHVPGGRRGSQGAGNKAPDMPLIFELEDLRQVTSLLCTSVSLAVK